MTAKETEKAEALDELRKQLKPGDTVFSVLRHVSRSGMSRRISFCVIRKGQPYWLDYNIGRALEYSRPSNGDGLRVDGCGMDMGFSVVHNLGYALWGALVRAGGSKATALRARMAKVDTIRHYLCQGGAKMPPIDKPADVWFGAAGYALNHRWM